jgi:hypothetical protein
VWGSRVGGTGRSACVADWLPAGAAAMEIHTANSKTGVRGNNSMWPLCRMGAPRAKEKLSTPADRENCWQR